MKTWFAKKLGATRNQSAGEAMVINPKEICPECGTKLAQTNNEMQSRGWHCPNLDCPAQLRARLLHWCSPEAMDIPGLDAALVVTLVRKGLAIDVAELYRVKLKELAPLEGMNEDRAKQVFEALTVSMKRDAWRVLFGLGIPLVGAPEALALARGFPTVDAVFAAGVPRLMHDSGVSADVAESLVLWHSDGVNRRLVRRLEKAGVNFKSTQYCRSA